MRSVFMALWIVCLVVLLVAVAGLVLIEVELWRERRDDKENDRG